MNPSDAKLVVAAFEKHLKDKQIPVPECVPAGNTRGVCVVCVDERLNPFDAGRKEFRNAGSTAQKFTGGAGPDYEMAYALNLILGSSLPGDNIAVMVTGHSNCLANTGLFEILTGTGSGNSARAPDEIELARLPKDLQDSLKKALTSGAEKGELVEAMTKVLALQNMQNLLEYKTSGGSLEEMLASQKIFPIVAVVDSKTNAVEVYDWKEKGYRPLTEIIKDAEKEQIHSPETAPESFVMKQGATTTTAAEFFGKELLETIRTAVERIGNMSAPGVAHGS